MKEPTPENNEPVIEMTGVTVGSRENPGEAVLENVNWRVMPGEYWVLGGMHGTGKTDFLAMTDGLALPLGGTYRLFGRTMPLADDLPPAEQLRIGMVFDGGQVFHHLTIEENVALPLRYHRELAGADFAQTIGEMLEWAELSPFAGRQAGTIGRAWQKRAGLARALVLQPEVLLLDNPLGGLDLRHVQWWLQTLEQLSTGRGPHAGGPMTLVVAEGDLRPWRNRPAHFAILQHRQFSVLGHHPRLEQVAEPLVREMLVEPLVGT